MLTSKLQITNKRFGLADRPAFFQPSFPSDQKTVAEPSVFEANPFAPSLSVDHETLTRHLEAACRYGSIIERVAVRHSLLPSLIAGFGSRQSGWGMDLCPAGPDGSTDFVPRLQPTAWRPTSLPPDGNGFARGLMQLDYDRHEMARNGPWNDAEANIDTACEFVSAYRSQLRRRTTLQGTGLLRAAFAAFESGIERVQRAIRQGLDVDSPTPRQRYGRDVMQRAGFFQAQGWD